MSETSLFGDDSMDYKSNLGSEVTDAYLAVRNLQYEDSVSDRVSEWCSNAAYDDGMLGDAQHEAPTGKTSEHDAGSSDFPTVRETDSNGESYILPAVDLSANDQKIVSELQWLLQTHLATSEKQPVAPAGNDGPTEEYESDDDSEEQNNESDNSHPVTAIPGVGNGTASEVATFFNTEPEAVSEILEAAESVKSFETAEVDRLAEVAGEERAEALRELFPDKSDEALIAFEQG